VKVTDYNKRLLLYILLGWIVINFIQAAVTGLFDDEALFWMYGQRPAWGYYEHSPMAGILIRAGYELFHNEFGVRFFFVILNTVSFYLVARLAGIRNPVLLAALVFTPVISQVGGFIAAPDVALIFFTTLFFMTYKKLLGDGSYLIAIIWGIIMAAMIYSKYSGILVIIFTIISNLKLIKRKFFYIAALTGILCMVPHILWSFRYDHPTVNYHLFERNFEQFDFFSYFTSYFIGQICIYGPLMGVIFFWAMVVFKPVDVYEKSLKFTSIGIILFFMAYTLRGNVEPCWTLPAFIPLIIMACKVAEEKKVMHRLVWPLAIASIVLGLGLRIYFVYDFLKLPRHVLNLTELYGWKEWSKEIEKKAGGRPVLFLNSCQRASKYIFYTGKPAYSMDAFDGHRTQYYYWNDMEESFQGKDIMVVDFIPWRWLPGKTAFTGSNHIITYYGYWNNFRSHNHLGIKLKLKRLRFPANASITLPVTIINPYLHPVQFRENKFMDSWLVCNIHYKDKFVAEMVPSTDITRMIITGATKDTSIRFLTPSVPGKYYFCVSVSTGWVPPPRNMNYQMMEIY